jgi:hypothetical protein
MPGLTEFRYEILARMSRVFMLAILLAGCTPLPLTPQDLEARKFEVVPDKAVIYMVRDSLDFSNVEAPIYIGKKLLLTTYPGTYYRWVVPAGKHTIVGYGQDSGTITVQVEQGRIYFVQQRVSHISVTNSAFELVSESQGRAAVLRSVLLTAP